MMKKFMQRLIKFAVYAAAGVVIMLAIAVGLFRLLLPRLPEYQEDIKSWASTAIGMNVEFTGMDARWGLNGPEIEFYNAELIAPDSMARIISAGEVSVGVGLMRLLIDRKLVVDRIVLRDTSIEVRQLGNGEWWIQGSPANELLPARRDGPETAGAIEVVGENIEVKFLQPGDERPRIFQVPRVVVRRDSVRIAVNAIVDLPEDLGGRLTMAATQLLFQQDEDRSWDVTIDVDDIILSGVSALHGAQAAHFSSGSGDLDLSLVIANGVVQSAVVDIDFQDVAVGDETGFSINGLFEFQSNTDGWLVAANHYQLQTVGGEWPDSSLRVEATTGSEGQITMLDARASYINLADIGVLNPWLTRQQRDLVAAFDPDGAVRELVATLSGIDTDFMRFDVSAEFVNVGIAAVDNRPGIRGFSGRLRADRVSGRLEIKSKDLAVSFPKYLEETAIFDDVSGTIIWRRSNNRTTVLSDSILIRNAVIEMETNVEITLADGSRTPIVDLATTWSISDLSKLRRYIPFMPKMPRTSEWLQEGLLAGRIPRGTIRLYGPLDKFPFDGGEGRLLIEANIRDALIMYQRRWPVAEVLDFDLVIDNTRLYSERNHIINVGNEITNARFEIDDLRQPVLTIDAFSTGTLESIRQLMAQSPIGTDVFGGRLDRVAVTGDGSFSLDLRVPIRDWQNFDFTSRLQISNASLQMEGFAPPITDLNGAVTIRRDDISSESLAGTFLGRPVSIELMMAPEEMDSFRVIASTVGTITAEGLTEGLGLPLEGLVQGETAYSARLLFPRGKAETPSPFTIEIETDLAGLGLDLPKPLQKMPDDSVAVSARIELPQGSERIVSTGTVTDLLSWELTFAKEQEQWDFDRGLVTFGVATAATTEPDAATEIRGLHLRGSIDYVRMQDWFALPKRNNAKTGMGERIRSIEMTIGHLHLLGQHLVDHRIRVDRSARDWLVQFDGDELKGSAFVPYDFNSGRTLTIEMERMVLPGDDEVSGQDDPDIDPRSLPPISIRANEFALGERYLGAFQAEFRHTADGLVADSIIARDETFEIVGNGGWIVDESDATGYRSFLTVTMTSTDVERTMQRLGYEPGIVSDQLSMLLDLSWSGGPREDFMESLRGEVKIQIGTGQLDDVEPGAGRVFGLMSIVALPRRLSLDFRDVFAKGFGFDTINGTFRIVDGETYTCNLSLEGPAANIGIVGRAGLVSRDYDQTAVVSANFGNTLPVVGAVVGGPQVAAVLLVFSQIFKKPLQEVSQIYYAIGGSWDEPTIETSSAREFARLVATSECVDEAQ